MPTKDQVATYIYQKNDKTVLLYVARIRYNYHTFVLLPLPCFAFPFGHVKPFACPQTPRFSTKGQILQGLETKLGGVNCPIGGEARYSTSQFLPR